MTRSIQLLAAVSIFGLSTATFAAEQIHLVEHPVNETTTHVGHKKVDAVGDILSFANPIFDAANKTQVATDQGFCIRTVVGKSWECAWTNVLKDGMITVAGPFSDTDADSTFVVTGGTGKYAGAKGKMVLHVRGSKPEAYDFTFDLL